MLESNESTKINLMCDLDIPSAVKILASFFPDDLPDKQGIIYLTNIEPPEDRNLSRTFEEALTVIGDCDANNAVWDGFDDPVHGSEGFGFIIVPGTQYYVYPKTVRILKAMGIPFHFSS